MHDPFLMKNMNAAVDRLQQALEEGEKVLVYGDYDVDGTTAVSLFYGFLSKHTEEIEFYIPDRYKEGYGVSMAGIEYANENNFGLIVTLDCGIKAIDPIEKASTYGIDVIVCDHHTPGDELPKAIVLDPKQKDCEYPFKELSGCGVGFKLLMGLCIELGFDQDPLLENLDLLAISIGADIVSVTGENRLLAQYGMAQLNKQPREGIDIMLKLAKKERPLTLTDVVFTIAPRINAAGRLGDAKQAVSLLIGDESLDLRELARSIHNDNDERKTIDKMITAEALSIIDEDEYHDEKVTNLVYKKGWHKGVVGIVASRIIESYYRPTIVLTQPKEGDEWTGSARSIKGINIYDVLEECKHLLERFGGHFYAAGLSLKEENLDEFKMCFDDAVRMRLDSETLIPEQILEKEISFHSVFTQGESIHEVPRLKRILKQFEPHGPGNMKPVFLTRNVFVKDAKLLKGEHLKMTLVEPGHDKPINAIAFSFPEAYEIVQQGPVDIVYTLEENQFRGRTTLQLNVKDLRPTEVSARTV
jgi:single-stranded-DNA-specific exonuclease